MGWARAGKRKRLEALHVSERDPAVADPLKQAVVGRYGQRAFEALDDSPNIGSA